MMPHFFAETTPAITTQIEAKMRSEGLKTKKEFFYWLLTKAKVIKRNEFMPIRKPCVKPKNEA